MGKTIFICVSFVSICGFKLLPKLRQFFRTEVGEDLAVHINHRRERLTGQRDHLGHGLAVGDNVERLVFDAALVEPTLRLVAPAAIRFYEETDFHNENLNTNRKILFSLQFSFQIGKFIFSGC